MYKHLDDLPCSQSPTPAVVACGSWYPKTFIQSPRRDPRQHLSDLEGQVLEEMRSAICFVRLCPAASINPNADGRGLSPR